jgi:hypothetical protein
LGDPRTSPSPHATVAHIDGRALIRAYAGATGALHRQADALNAINIFPVPDGDTGTNMHFTMRAAFEAAKDAEASVATVAARAAQGALMGAKGNSGVILSQWLAGLATVDAESWDATSLADAFAAGRDGAYRVISAPKEGTILTTMRAAAEAAQRASLREGAEAALAAAVEEAEATAARTPELLPVLKDAGVVDAGAQGFFVLLEGMLHGVRGQRAASHPGGFGQIDATWLAAMRRVHGQAEAAGYCTEFVVEGERLDAASIRDRLSSLGDSLLVVGGGPLLRVHVHTADPERALEVGRSAGTVIQQKIDDLEFQVGRLTERTARQARSAGATALVAVAAGDGLEALMESLGAIVVRGGQTMNPSAGEIREAVESAGATAAIVLPNNANIALAAKQAVADLPVRSRVVETRSVPQGIAALIAFNPEAGLEENVAAMERALHATGSAEVTHAARATAFQGRAIKAGQPIGIIDGELAVAEDSVAAAVRACVQRLIDGRDAPFVTLYAGAGESEGTAGSLAEALRTEFGVDVEVVDGGQPHYPYLIGVD